MTEHQDKSTRPARTQSKTNGRGKSAGRAETGHTGDRTGAFKPKPGAREVALEILTRVEQDRSYSNLLLNKSLQKHGLDAKEAGLVTELVYGTIQRLNTIDYFLNKFVSKGLVKLEPWVRNLLRLSFYQLYYLDRIPSHAAVNEAVNLAKKRGHQGISGMVNGVLRSVLRQKDQLALPEGLEPAARIALEQSHPEWMVRRWMETYGEEAAESMCAANNRPPHASARVNRLKHTPEEMLARMAEAGLSAAPSRLAPAGIVVEGGGNLAATPWYAAGEITVQDESSMLVAEAVQPEPGMAVLDCCAAPGGKTTHLAERMENRGEIVACDVHEHKERLISEQAERLGLSCIRTVVSDAKDLPRQFEAGRFDRILLDAPCSGLGVIRRKPDLKWSKREEEIREIQTVQREILEAVHPLLKPGGILVYSTCTTEPEENERAIAAFLENHRDFQPDPFPVGVLPEALRGQGDRGMVQLLPQDYQTDGFFIARLRKRPV